jgi:hypothetical protein
MYLEPWDLNLVRHTLGVGNPEDYYVLSDEQAYEIYKDHQHWYDKVYISENWSKIPTVYGEVICKPRINLQGMGYECTYPELEKMLIQKRVYGRHLSIDWCINPKAKISDSLVWNCYSVFQAHKDPKTNSFQMFERLPKLDSWEVYSTADLVIKQLRKEGYKGRFVNMEFIGPYLIEVHLRPSVQFINIDGGLIKYGLTGGDLPEAHEAYSVVYRYEKDKVLKSFELPERMPEGVASFHVCCDVGRKLSNYVQDFKTFRYLVINGVDLEAIKAFKKSLEGCLVWESVKS